MRADDARLSTCALDVEVSWGDGDVLASEHLRGPCTYRLQTEPLAPNQAGFVVQREWLDEDVLCLARSEGDDLRVTHASGQVQVLQRGDQSCVHVGPLVFRIAAVAPREPAPAAPWTARQHAWTLASLAVHAVALGCMLLMPPHASSLSLDMESEDGRYMRYLSTPVAMDDPQLPWTPRDAAHADDSGAKAAGDEGQAGKPEVIKSDRRMAVQGRDERRLPAKQVQASEARTAGILGVLAQNSVQPYFSGADTPLGYDAQAAIGALFGRELGDDSGFNGLGMRNTGRGGGGDARDAIGIGLLDTGSGARRGLGARGMDTPRRNEHVPTLRAGEADVRGSLSKEVIRRAIHLHLNEVRFCYERALVAAPDLAGRVSVTFIISPAGAVPAVTIKESTLPSAEVARCVAQAVRRFTFPAPEGGGIVQVTYPFTFSAH